MPDERVPNAPVPGNCNTIYRVGLPTNVIYCDENPLEHGPEHHAKVPNGDVYWRR